jgi:hypothetical protein
MKIEFLEASPDPVTPAALIYEDAPRSAVLS